MSAPLSYVCRVRGLSDFFGTAVLHWLAGLANKDFVSSLVLRQLFIASQNCWEGRFWLILLLPATFHVGEPFDIIIVLMKPKSFPTWTGNTALW